MPAGEQTRVFLAMALCGMALGVCYDALALLRSMLGNGRIVTGILDLAFGALFAAGMSLTALRMQVDPFRWYEFAGAGAGFLLYECSMGTIVRFIWITGKRIVKKR